MSVNSKVIDDIPKTRLIKRNGTGIITSRDVQKWSCNYRVDLHVHINFFFGFTTMRWLTLSQCVADPPKLCSVTSFTLRHVEAKVCECGWVFHPPKITTSVTLIRTAVGASVECLTHPSKVCPVYTVTSCGTLLRVHECSNELWDSTESAWV